MRRQCEEIFAFAILPQVARDSQMFDCGQDFGQTNDMGFISLSQPIQFSKISHTYFLLSFVYNYRSRMYLTFVRRPRGTYPGTAICSSSFIPALLKSLKERESCTMHLTIASSSCFRSFGQNSTSVCSCLRIFWRRCER